MTADYRSLINRFGDAVHLNEALSRYTVARLGGPADVLIEAREVDALAAILTCCWQAGFPTRIIGGGANVLIGDNGYRGVIVVNQTKGLHIDAASGVITAESGVSLTTLARETIAQGLSGFEWAIGVPGTAGGAVVNNAGAHGRDMAASLQTADVIIAPDQRETWPVTHFQYHYRESALKHRGPEQPSVAVLRVQLRFTPGNDPAALRAIADGYQTQRKRSQPPGASLGSMFKNPPGDYAGRLIEAAGLKGLQIGGVQISSLHANFFVNLGGGSAADYQALIGQAQAAVRAQFGIDLALEVEVIGEGESGIAGE